MPRKRANNIIPPQAFSPEILKHEQIQNEIQESILKIEEKYRVEIAKIESNFAVFDEEYFRTFQQYETDFSAAIAYVEDEYRLLFDALLNDLEDNSKKQSYMIAKEQNEYDTILGKFESLQKQAHEKYIELCKVSEAYIDREALIHTNFVNDEDARFDAMRKNYSSINNKQYDTLLWSMEKSKNSLGDLSKKLNDQGFNDAKFLTTSVIKTIEDLREAKNNITVLFKTTTQVFSQKKKVIDDLSLVRQKPHSVLNQKLINQFVEQIHNVNDQRQSFETLVKNDLKKSVTTISEKLIQADHDNDDKLIKKYIMQYKIINAKAEFLLKRNREMSDLLIQKYQNEIKKIKIDSFRRVEEIKLAYYMPSEFFQNSINLYSNFAFYINESMDEIDNMLSDFIRFNQNIAQTATDYVYTSSKIFEDYKINLLVTVNDATNRLTELITNVDRISKEIIELESKNRLEIAQIRKDMENLDITGDYQKYVKSLEFDRFFADYQHKINTRKLSIEYDKTEKLLSIQKQLTDSNLKREKSKIDTKHVKLLNDLERKIHESALDKQFMIAETMHRKTLELIESTGQLAYSDEELIKMRKAFVIGKAIENQENEYIKTEKNGNAYVVDFVHETQKLIDLHKIQTANEKDYISNDTHQLRYARVIENERNKTIKVHSAKYNDMTLQNRQAVTYLSQYLFKTHTHLRYRIDKTSNQIKNMLVNLNEETLSLQLKVLEAENMFKYNVFYTFDSAVDTLKSVNDSCHLSKLSDQISTPVEHFIYRYNCLCDEIFPHLFKKMKSKNKINLVEKFYIETLLLIKDYHTFLVLFFDYALEESIQNDVLTIRSKREKQFEEQKIIDDHYDQRIFEAATKKSKTASILSHLDLEYANFELLMKERVFQLNQTFLTVLKKEKEKLKFVKTELLKSIDDIDQDNKKTKSKIAKSIACKIAVAQLNFYYIENDYKAKKIILFDEAQAQALAKDNELEQTEKEQSTYLETLNQSIATLPEVQNREIEQMESAKLALMNEKRAILNRELTEIEEKKLLATPIYLDQIEAVKSRLPNDYMVLYKEIALAEEQLINEHRNIETIYQQNFGRFIGNQMEYNSILFNDSVILHPFDKQMDSTKKIIKKSNELFKDTLDKSSMAQDKINKKTVESNEKQKRVLNV
jgi:hypothetical protein